ncbi:MAG: hypothetical protein R3F42_05950 [Pseudomonadota bacterium]
MPLRSASRVPMPEALERMVAPASSRPVGARPMKVKRPAPGGHTRSAVSVPSAATAGPRAMSLTTLAQATCGPVALNSCTSVSPRSAYTAQPAACATSSSPCPSPSTSRSSSRGRAEVGTVPSGCGRQSPVAGIVQRVTLPSSASV